MISAGISRGIHGLASIRSRRAAPTASSHEDLRRSFREASPEHSIAVLTSLIKQDLERRFQLGEKPAARDYFDSFPELLDHKDRVVSLVYEEFCLLEEVGGHPSPDEFCERYDAWKDSLGSQLYYHEVLSQVVSLPARSKPRYPGPGERFAGFQLNSVLGEGGAARVFLATEVSLGNREVALKLSNDRSLEPAIQGRLDHEHIVPVMSVVDDPETGLRGLCMPYRKGRPLQVLLRRVFRNGAPKQALELWRALFHGDEASESAAPTGPGWMGFPARGTYADAAAWLVEMIALALAHAHRHGIVHRDVKPANVLVAVREGPQLLDFNLAHDPNSPLQAQTALWGGTIPYMAPEQLRAFLDPEQLSGVRAASDLYALGLVLREMVTGELPVAPAPDTPLPRALREQLDVRLIPPPPVRQTNPDVPHALQAIIDRCLAVDPSDRYASADQLAEDLRCFHQHRNLRYARNPSTKEKLTNLTRQWWPLAAGIAAAGIAGGWLGVSGASFGVAAVFSPAPTASPIDASAAAKAAYDRGKADFVAGQFDGALTNFSRAIQYDAGHHKAYFGISNVYLEENKFDLALRNNAKAFKLAEAAAPLPANDIFALYYDQRGYIALERARMLQSSKSPAAFESALPHFNHALADAETARLLLEGNTLDRFDRKQHVRLEYLTATARVGLGDVASQFEHYDVAIRNYLKAQRAVDRGLHLLREQTVLAPLAADIRRRIRTDGAMYSIILAGQYVDAVLSGVAR